MTIQFKWWPLGDSNPCYRRERAVSWPLDQGAVLDKYLCFLVAGAGFEPTTFGLWARRATNCSTPRYYYCFLLPIRNNGAEDRDRTGTIISNRRILSPVRLPVPPLRQNSLAPKVGFEPTAYRLTVECSTIELLRNKVGCDLLSRDPTVRVSSAMQSLTSVFGMGTGVSSTL